MEFNHYVYHEEMTDEKAYNNIKILNKKYPEEFMDPEQWKKERLVVIKKEGKNWSR
jgi:hypothetical protein|tara:strand:- start:8160 stop:8327 length:168 start_codon:yes stop_codon:yes gene_type:complete